MSSSKKRYDAEFKREAVRLLLNQTEIKQSLSLKKTDIGLPYVPHSFLKAPGQEESRLSGKPGY